MVLSWLINLVLMVVSSSLYSRNLLDSSEKIVNWYGLPCIEISCLLILIYFFSSFLSCCGLTSKYFNSSFSKKEPVKIYWRLMESLSVRTELFELLLGDIRSSLWKSSPFSSSLRIFVSLLLSTSLNILLFISVSWRFLIDLSVRS